MTTITSLFATYGITGNPTIDALLLTTLIPILVSYVTTIFTFIQSFLTRVLLRKIISYYCKFKRRFLGIVDFRLGVSQEKNIYPTIRNIFFSSVTKSDDIDSKTLGILNLITEVNIMMILLIIIGVMMTCMIYQWMIQIISILKREWIWEHLYQKNILSSRIIT